MDNRNKPTAEQLNKMLTSLFQEYADYLLDYAQNYGCSPDLAEDMVQETFTTESGKPVLRGQSTGMAHFDAAEYGQQLSAEPHVRTAVTQKTGAAASGCKT